LAANNVLSQGDIDALLAGATPSLEAPPDSGPSAPAEAAAPAAGGASSEEVDALSEKVASLEGALGKLEQIDTLVARIDQLESTVTQMQQLNASNLQKLQMGMMQRLNAVMEMVKASQGAQQGQQPGPGGQQRQAGPATSGQAGRTRSSGTAGSAGTGCTTGSAATPHGTQIARPEHLPSAGQAIGYRIDVPQGDPDLQSTILFYEVDQVSGIPGIRQQRSPVHHGHSGRQ
jgi:TolA-binding protein